MLIGQENIKSMLELIEFKGEKYPAFQAKGFAAKFAFPFALEVCKGNGYDIGCNRAEWAFPGACPIDPVLNTGAYDANNLPDIKMDYIFSSHCLEHVDHWVNTLDYWYTKLKEGGICFLYLPDISQLYWHPWSNRKHAHVFTPKILSAYFKTQPDKWKNVFVSGIDLNNSFMVMAEKL